MSIEDSINRLADALNRIADAMQARPMAVTGAAVAPPVSEYAGPDADAAPRRGRPPGTKNKPKEDEGAAEPTPVQAAVEETPAEEPAAQPILLDDVRAALMQLKEKDGNRDRCIAIIKRHTGQEVLTGIKDTAFAPIVEDVRKLL